ncbi:hypothetical protein [Streptomyces sp. NPDC001978]|uniref:hypothetical protein n=1 Tax=Streptomyces sp. NPDC001978 TaxID=3364627 RepID=UPI0036CA1F2F
MTARLSERAFTRRACGIGARGFRAYDWAVIDTSDPEHRFVVRRALDRSEVAYFHCFTPRLDPLGEVIRAIGTRWLVEMCQPHCTHRCQSSVGGVSGAFCQ